MRNIHAHVMFLFHLYVYSTMVLWFTILFYVFLFFIVYKNIRMETLNKNSTYLQIFVSGVKCCSCKVA